ncbi:hypothetical protein [Candidatus Solincola tengchongensis]|uniref:hypothetical protein n=1 Tax=Candidatus Solincola tengchongensis TaxID=2900693 RepID=UPI00257B56FC|nr:hypothetical protein [Candidatus Solincola tengchongensis]
MTGIELCPECGVPRHITSEHMWLNGGIIVQSRDRRNRMVFVECENLDPLFAGVQELIGLPIEHMLITAKRRAVRAYLGSLLPDVTKELLRRRELDWRPVNDGLRLTARLMGYGRYEVVDYRFEKDVDDYVVETISEPYSVPLACGDMAGAFEILFGCDLAAKYRRLTEDLYEITCYVSSHPEELKGRLKFRHFPVREGDVELERCKSCGGPLALSNYRWHPERGIILGSTTGKRMIMTGMEVDAIFGELENEIGEDLPGMFIEAQRRFVRAGFYSIEGMGRLDMRDQLALRGLGNLTELRSNQRGLYFRIENAFLHLMVVGLVQGLYEMTYDVDTHLEWNFSEDGVLEVSLSPKGQAKKSAVTA